MASAATMLAKGWRFALDDSGYNGLFDPCSNFLPVATVIATAKATATALYLQEAGDTSLISVNDIHQGQIGDCFLLASIGEIALWHPNFITSMIQPNANGTETVTLYLSASGTLPTYGTTSFKATTVTIDNTFPSNAVNNGASQGVVNGQKEIWVQVLEKAVATLEGGYSAISNGGNPMIAMKELVGQSATYMSPSSLTLSLLQGFVAAGDLIVMDTYSSGALPYGLYNNHAYMFESVTVVNGTAMVQLGNPWGTSQPSLIPLSQLSTGIIEVDIGQFPNSNAISGTAGDDTIVLSNPVLNASIDLGAGSDTLTFANGTNSATVANAETILGGTGNDTITLASAFTAGMSVDLGSGSNKLTLQATGNTGTVSNVATLIGGSGSDSISYGSSLVNGSVDLGVGNDTLRLYRFTNRVSVAHTETVIGGSGNDTIVLTGSDAGTVIGGGGLNFITGSTAGDKFVFDQNSRGSISIVTNFSAAKGDLIALDTIGSSTLSGNTYDLGGASLVLGQDLTTVANVAALLTTTLANSGKGGFAYEQDTGELFYSANGSFTQGGSLLGIITTNGATPWTFNANGFVQV